MKKLTEADNNIQAQFIVDHISAAGIRCHSNGKYLQGAVGELPALHGPAIWIEDEQQFDKAKEILSAVLSEPQQSQFYQDDWKCPECSEVLEAVFTQCWQCGFTRNHQGQPQ